MNYLGNKDESSEESKSNIFYESATSDSSPNKSIAQGDEIFESFTDPLADGFQLDFRLKPLENLKSDHHSMRHKFLNKLAQNKVWLLPHEKPKTNQTVIIFDWDDTLLCTTFLNPNGFISADPVPLSYFTFLTKLEDVVITILSNCLKLGKVFIITNAAEGWVEFSSQRYMPKVSKLLSKIIVISARSNYEHLYPGDSYEWKTQAFMDTMRVLDICAVTNIVAIGDSNIEMNASKHLSRKFPTALLKTVKFREAPSPDELIKQIILVTERMESICLSVKNLTIRLERRAKNSEDDDDSKDHTK